MAYLFILVIVFFMGKKCLILIKTHHFFLFFISSFMPCAFDVISKKSLSYFRSWGFTSVFPCKSFGSMIHFKLISSFFCTWISSFYSAVCRRHCFWVVVKTLKIGRWYLWTLENFWIFLFYMALLFHQCHTVLTTIALW